jgi:hypothetical protein
VRIYAKQPLPDELPLDIPPFVRTQIQKVAQVHGKTTWELHHTCLPSDALFSCLFLDDVCWLALHGCSSWIEHEKTERRLHPLDGGWVGATAAHAWLLFTPPATAASGLQFDASHLFIWSIWFLRRRPALLPAFLDGREKDMAYRARLAGEIKIGEYIGGLMGWEVMTEYQVTAVEQMDQGVLLSRQDARYAWRCDQIWLPDQFPVAVPLLIGAAAARNAARGRPSSDPLNPHQSLF